MNKNIRGQSDVTILVLAVFGAFFLLGLGGAACYGCPKYQVYQQELEGEAELAKARYSAQVATQAAEAKKNSAQNLADAEVIRAEGVAKANKIIGESLKDNDGYLRYLWIQNLGEQGKDHEVIYIPTEAGLPILEAGRNMATQKVTK